MTDKPIKATLDSSDDSVKTQKPILIQLDDIPTPTDADAGKVLGVDEDGKYELVQGGGGGGVFNVNFDLSNSPYTADKTLAEINEAINNGNIVLCHSNFIDSIVGVPDGEGGIIFPYIFITYANNQLHTRYIGYYKDGETDTIDFDEIIYSLGDPVS